MLRILTCNIRGLRSHAKCVNVFNQFACDVLCLQETWWDAGVVQSVEALWPGLVFHSSGLDRSRGVAVLFRPGVVSDVVCVWRDEAGRVLILDFQLEGRQYRLGCVYAPTDIAERVVFFEGLSQWCNADCLWVGDFNTKLSALDQGRCLEGGKPGSPSLLMVSSLPVCAAAVQDRPLPCRRRSD